MYTYFHILMAYLDSSYSSFGIEFQNRKKWVFRMSLFCSPRLTMEGYTYFELHHFLHWLEDLVECIK